MAFTSIEKISNTLGLLLVTLAIEYAIQFILRSQEVNFLRNILKSSLLFLLSSESNLKIPAVAAKGMKRFPRNNFVNSFIFVILNL